MADIDVSGPQAPGWWFQVLAKDLMRRQGGYQLLDDYMTGLALAPHTSSKEVREAYARLMRLAHTNYAELVVEAVRERMQPLGFRTGASGDDLGDEEAWRIWQANGLDADAGIGHRAGLSMGRFYVMVGGVDPDLEAPTITLEDPRQVITFQDPVKRWLSRASLKVFRDDIYGAERAFVCVGGYVYRYARPLSPTGPGVAPEPMLNPEGLLAGGTWVEESFDVLPGGQVPVVEFTNRTDLMKREPYGEYETHLSTLDRINYGLLNRLEIMTLQAFKQRAIKGVPRTDEKGQEIDYSDVFNSDPGAIWHLPDTADIWESGEVDVGPLRLVNRDDVQDLAAVTRTPLFYLTPEAANGSAEGASLAREGLVFKTKDRLGSYGERWEQVMALAFLSAGDTERSKRRNMEIMWADPEHFSMAERYDAAVKAQAAGVPWRHIMAKILQFTPQEIARMEQEREAEEEKAAKLAERTAVAVAAVGAPAPGTTEVPPESTSSGTVENQ